MVCVQFIDSIRHDTIRLWLYFAAAEWAIILIIEQTNTSELLSSSFDRTQDTHTHTHTHARACRQKHRRWIGDRTHSGLSKNMLPWSLAGCDCPMSVIFFFGFYRIISGFVEFDGQTRFITIYFSCLGLCSVRIRVFRLFIVDSFRSTAAAHSWAIANVCREHVL